jgi:hypothetical protein
MLSSTTTARCETGSTEGQQVRARPS